MFIMTIFATLIALLTVVSAAPLQQRDVFVPKILVPHRKTVWKIGTQQEVVWDTSNPPAQITNGKGIIVLAKAGRLDVEHPLAFGFDILDGKHFVNVSSSITPGADYQIVLFGDSGNMGPMFKITH